MYILMIWVFVYGLSYSFNSLKFIKFKGKEMFFTAKLSDFWYSSSLQESIKPKMEYCRHICVGASQSSFSSFDNVYANFWDSDLFSVLESISHKRNVRSLYLLCCYFRSKCSDERSSL